MYYNLFKLHKIIFFCSLVVCQNLAQAQTQKIDSLKNLLASTSGIEKADVYYHLAFESIVAGNNERGLEYADQSYGIAQDNSDSLRIVRAGRLKGSALRRLERLNEAVAVYTEAVDIGRRNNFNDELKILLNSLAVTYTIIGEYDKALNLYHASLEIREKSGDLVEMSIAINNIGLVYFKIKNYEKAIEFYNRALELKEEAKTTEGLETLLINLGLCYNQLNRFSDAQEYINRGLTVCGSGCIPQVLIEGEFGLGVSSYGQKFYTSALKYFLSSLKRSEEDNNKRFQAENLVYIGRIFAALNRYNDSKEYLAKAERIAVSTGFNQPLIDTYREFANVFIKENNFEKAASYQYKYIHLKDSIYSERLIENIAKVQTEFAERENIKTIASKEVVIRQQRDLNIAIAIIAILALLLILVLQRSNRVSKQVNAQLSEAKETIQQQNKLLEIKNKDLDREVEKKTADLERVNISLKQVNDELDNFIYKTSHDIRGPLASLKGMCNVALMDVQDPIALDYLRKLDATAERLNSILTRLLIINQINNSKLSVSRIDFSRIINDILLLEKKKGLPPKINIRKKIYTGPELDIHSDKELVRIVLENLIDNAIKFYNESDRVNSFVEVDIAPTPDGFVKARVIDNGIGISESNPGKLFQMFFRASERSEIGGIGLYIVKTATTKIGGKVGLLTTPEGYTEFYVLFPNTPPNGEEYSTNLKKRAV